jgi:hypothetical protein
MMMYMCNDHPFLLSCTLSGRFHHTGRLPGDGVCPLYGCLDSNGERSPGPKTPTVSRGPLRAAARTRFILNGHLLSGRENVPSALKSG